MNLWQGVGSTDTDWALTAQVDWTWTQVDWKSGLPPKGRESRFLDADVVHIDHYIPQVVCHGK